jgi:hypothetical protein
MIHHILSWFPLPILAIMNGILREKLIKDKLGDLRAHQVSTISALVIFSIYIWLLFQFWQPESSLESVKMGITWFVLTLAFEFIFMHFVFKIPFSRLLSDYRFWKGRLWILVLLWALLAPYLLFNML